MNTNNPIIESLQNFDIIAIEGVRFFQEDGKSYSISHDSIKRMALHIVSKYKKNEFLPFEFQAEIEYFRGYFQSSLSTEEFTILMPALTTWSEVGGRFEILKAQNLATNDKKLTFLGKIRYYVRLIPFYGISRKAFLWYLFLLYLGTIILATGLMFLGASVLVIIVECLSCIVLFYLFLRRWRDGIFHTKKMYYIYFGTITFALILLLVLIGLNLQDFYKLGFVIALSPFVLFFGGPKGFESFINGGDISIEPLFMLYLLGFTIIGSSIMSLLIIFSPRSNK